MFRHVDRCYNFLSLDQLSSGKGICGNVSILWLQVLGPLAGNSLFNEDDFKLLENFDMDLYARKVRNQVGADRQLKGAFVFFNGTNSIFD